MTEELISKKTRNEFREFLVGWMLRDIEMEFEAAHIDYDRQYDPQLSGQRRSFVEQHYHTLDFTNPSDVRKLLFAYENILNTAVRSLPDQWDKEASERTIDGLIEYLKRDGFKYKDSKITPSKPKARKVFDEALTHRSISELTRRDIFDTIRAEEIEWWGRLSELDFVSRLYDLDNLPSHDHRFASAQGDIWQHRENNPDDWAGDWIFTDSRFDLMHGSDETFLEFICAMVHPVVRPNADDVGQLVTMFNKHLAGDGWEIVARTHMSGKPVFAGRHRITQGSPALGAAKSLIDVLNADYVIQQINRMEASVQSDPELAIGTAKEFVETVCKTILSESGNPAAKNLDLLQLVKKVRKELQLLPDDIPHKAKGAATVKRVLSNLGAVAQGLAELRGLYGSGHGKDARVKGLQSRHAKLAVGAAGTLAVFLFETYQARKEQLV